MPAIFDMANPRLSEMGNSFPFWEWLQVLARPHLYQMLTRQPSREHLLVLCDAHMPYARSRRELAKEQGYSADFDEALMSASAERMRVLLEGWEPHDLTPEIVDTARALLVAYSPSVAPDWGFTPALHPGETLDDILVWPSGKRMPR